MPYARTFDHMTLCSLTPEGHERTCNYWYTVTTYGCTPHTAFRTRAAALAWLEHFSLSIDGELPDPGTHGIFSVAGSYRRIGHLDPDALRNLEGDRIPCLDNGSYTLGIITTDADGLRTLHHLNCNLDRIQIDHTIGRRLEDEGALLTAVGA